MRQDSTKAIVESGLMSALAVILVLMGWYLPVVGALISLIAPLPFLVVSAKHGCATVPSRWLCRHL